LLPLPPLHLLPLLPHSLFATRYSLLPFPTPTRGGRSADRRPDAACIRSACMTAPRLSLRRGESPASQRPHATSLRPPSWRFLDPAQHFVFVLPWTRQQWLLLGSCHQACWALSSQVRSQTAPGTPHLAPPYRTASGGRPS